MKNWWHVKRKPNFTSPYLHFSLFFIFYQGKRFFLPRVKYRLLPFGVLLIFFIYIPNWIFYFFLELLSFHVKMKSDLLTKVRAYFVVVDFPTFFSVSWQFSSSSFFYQPLLWRKSCQSGILWYYDWNWKEIRVPNLIFTTFLHRTSRDNNDDSSICIQLASVVFIMIVNVYHLGKRSFCLFGLWKKKGLPHIIFHLLCSFGCFLIIIRIEMENYYCWKCSHLITLFPGHLIFNLGPTIIMFQA